MSETGGQVFEGVGRPEVAKKNVGEKVRQAVKEVFTKEGRTDLYERQWYKKFGSVTESLNLTPDQQKTLQASVRARMEKAAVTNLTRERVGMAIVTAAGSYAAFRNREKIGKVLTEVLPRTGSAFEQFKVALDKSQGMGIKTRVPIMLHEFAAGFKFWQKPTPTVG